MSTTNLDAADLRAVTRGGLIREDVMNKIFDISRIPLPFTDMIGTDTSSHPIKEWTVDALANPDITNARVDGADAGANNTVTGNRVGNHHQISDKVVKVSYRADSSNTIGRAKELAYQLSRRQQELRRDVEAIMLLNQPSGPDDGNATPGKVGGLPSWITTNVQLTGAQAVGGFNAGTGNTGAFTRAAAAVGLTETKVRVAAQQVYQQGGEASVFMSTPDVVQAFSSYLFTSSARVATLMSDIEGSAAKATAMGSVNVFVTDFGTLKFVPNRLQPKFTIAAVTNAADVFVLDPSYLSVSYLQGYRTEELAKTGSANNRQILVDYTLVVGNEKAQAMINDINPATAVVA
jgi:hypothetical protein